MKNIQSFEEFLNESIPFIPVKVNTLIRSEENDTYKVIEITKTMLN